MLNGQNKGIMLSMQAPIEETIHLVQKAQAGDQEALNRLFSRYYGRVQAFVRSRLGPELRLEAESTDIMQETFLAAIWDFDQYEVQSQAGFIQWLSAIAENRIRQLARRTYAEKRDRRRQQALRRLRDSIHDESVQIEPAASITLPGVALEKKEAQERLTVALDKLSPQGREVILLRTQGEATWPEIATIIGKGSESAARQLHARAMLELTSLLRDE